MIAISLVLDATAATTQPVNLGAATSFAVLGGSAITVIGEVDSTTIYGDVGSFPTPAMTGFENVKLYGVNHGGDTVTQAAKLDLVTAYDDAVSRTPTTIYAAATDLGTRTLAPGVYNSPTSIFLSGVLTLEGTADDVWIFQAGSTVISAANSVVTLMGGAKASNVFWQVGSSVTLESGTQFAGTLLVLTAITLNTGVVVDGRLLARNAAVSLDHSNITSWAAVPEPSNLLCGVLLAAGALRRRVAR